MIRPGPVIQMLHLISYLLPLSHCCRPWSVGMIFNHPFRIRHPEHASKFDLSRLRLGKQQTVPTRGTNFLRASHKRVFHQRPPTASPTDTHPHCDFIQTLQTIKRLDQSTGKDPVHTLIDVLCTQTFTQDQIEDTPTISAAIAAPTFNGNAILLIVTHFLCLPL